MGWLRGPRVLTASSQMQDEEEEPRISRIARMGRYKDRRTEHRLDQVQAKEGVRTQSPLTAPISEICVIRG